MPAPSSVARSNLASGARPVWLCTLTEPDGSTIRVATLPVSVPLRNPGTSGPYQYHPFLSGVSDFEEVIDLFSLDAVGSLTQALVDITTTEDLAARQGDWYHLAASIVELALYWPGQDWEDRIVVLDGGTVQNISFGVVGQATTFSLEQTPPSTSASVGDDTRDIGTDHPDPLLDVSAATMTSVVGAKYQVVYGDPRSVPVVKVGDVGGNDRAIMAGHEFPDLTALERFSDGVSIGTASPLTDGKITYLEAGAGSYGSADGAVTYAAQNGGIAKIDDATKPCLSAADILRRLLTETGLRVDHRRMERTYQLLADWPMGFYLDSEALAIDIIRDHVAPFLPVIEMSGGDGLWFFYADALAIPSEAELIYGQHLVGRVGRVKTSDLEAVRNRFTINYYYEVFSGAYQRTVVVDASNSPLCYLSDQLARKRGELNGTRAADPIDARSIWSDAAARRLGLALAARFALPRRIVEYQLAPDAYWVDAGTGVFITDTARGIGRHPAVITRINRSMTPFVATLDLIDRTPATRPL